MNVAVVFEAGVLALVVETVTMYAPGFAKVWLTVGPVDVAVLSPQVIV